MFNHSKKKIYTRNTGYPPDTIPTVYIVNLNITVLSFGNGFVYQVSRFFFYQAFILGHVFMVVKELTFTSGVCILCICVNKNIFTNPLPHGTYLLEMSRQFILDKGNSDIA